MLLPRDQAGRFIVAGGLLFAEAADYRRKRINRVAKLDRY